METSLASVLNIHSFSAHYAVFSLRSVINGEQHEKYLYQPLRKICSIWLLKRTSIINWKVGVSLDHDVSLCFLLLLALQTCWATFQAKNIARSALASYPSLTLNPYLSSKGKRNGAQRRTKLNFSRTTIQALCCGWQKGTSRDEATLNSEEIKAVATYNHY